MDSDSKIFVAGHKGLVGSAIVRNLESNGHTNIITRTRDELDLTNSDAVKKFFMEERPEYVFLAAAKVGGIGGNSDYPADFIYENLMIQSNIISCAAESEVKKLLFLGSSCIYPKFAEQPITEDQLLSGHLESSNEAYAIAKIAGIKMCQAYRRQHGLNAISLMPTNLYGPNDNFDHNSSHVLPAMIRKFHEAKINNHSDVVLWGSGSPMREFLFVDDMAEAVVFAMENNLPEHLYNIGTGKDIAIKDLAEIIQRIIGHKGNILWDNTKPDGTPRKLMDVSKMKELGWQYSTEIEEGIEKTYTWFLENIQEIKKLNLK